MALTGLTPRALGETLCLVCWTRQQRVSAPFPSWRRCFGCTWSPDAAAGDGGLPALSDEA
jgi:hypothetical protein